MTRKYKTLRKFVHNGRVLAKGETVELHPNQAKYLLGTHLELADAGKGGGKSTKSTKTQGDQ
ncbi:hypothetical protein [Salinisphaera orenii]|uniref:hypothetical protein n=1 Tax=Salinisphaera orenii TaxID=856731 RepID=UPI000DBE5951